MKIYVQFFMCEQNLLLIKNYQSTLLRIMFDLFVN